MRNAATHPNTLDDLVAALQSGSLDEAAARRLYQLGPHAVTLALLSAARRIAEQDSRLAEGVIAQDHGHRVGSMPGALLFE